MGGIEVGRADLQFGDHVSGVRCRHAFALRARALS